LVSEISDAEKTNKNANLENVKPSVSELQIAHLPPLVADVSWTKNIVIIQKCKDPLERIFYIKATRRFGWTKDVLINNIENKTYERYLTNQTNFDEEAIIIPGEGGIGDIFHYVVGKYGISVFIDSDTEFAFQRHIAILRPDSNVILPKYLYHAMQSSDFMSQAHTVATGAAQKTITLTALNKMKVPLPHIDEQARIVDILDRFNELVFDMKSGLPAEIAAR